jgi:F-type H+-transporting ATPase subunit delta
MRDREKPIIQNYASALLDVARAAGELDEIFVQSQMLEQVFARSRDLLIFMERPNIAKEVRKAFLRKVFKGKLSPILLNLAQMLVDKNRGTLWDEITAEFVGMVELERGIRSAEISTATELAWDEKASLTRALEKYTKAKLRIHFHEIPDLLGGVMFRYGDTLIDGTLRGGLNRIKYMLQGAQVD